MEKPNTGLTETTRRSADQTKNAWKKCMELLQPEVDRLTRLDRACYAGLLEDMSEAVYEAGAPSRGCIGFVDTTYIRSLRPSKLQRNYYNGYYGHGWKYLTVALACGLSGHAFGPCTVRAGDGRIVRESGLEFEMKNLCFRNGQWKYFIYGDWAFGLRPWLWTQIRFPNDEDEEAFNSLWSRCRTAVEWKYHVIKGAWKTVEFKAKNYVLKSRSDRHLGQALFLSNLRTCIRGRNMITDFFKTTPPSLQEYIAQD